jgi:hypothetical protein
MSSISALGMGHWGFDKGISETVASELVKFTVPLQELKIEYYNDFRRYVEADAGAVVIRVDIVRHILRPERA